MLTVVVGKAIVLASKLDPQAIVLVAVQVISTMSFCQWVGVQDKLVVIEVILAASAVILCISVLSVFIVGVALDVSLVTRGVILLLVSVSVLDAVILAFNCVCIALVTHFTYASSVRDGYVAKAADHRVFQEPVKIAMVSCVAVS